MDVITRIGPPPQLRDPLLVLAFEGWNDAGEAATRALRVLRRELDATRIAEIDGEEFYDFQVNRPRIRFARDGSRRLEWPTNRISTAALPGGERDVVLVHGIEPNLRWRTFVDALVDFADDLGVVTAVCLGALQVDVPHTRPVPVTGSATSERLRRSASLRTSSYEGPTGITGVITQACSVAGMEAVSLWAGVPHYLAGTPYVAGALALVERVGRIGDFSLELSELAQEASEQRAEIAALVAEDEDLGEYVAELEQRADELPADAELASPLMTGDELAADIERYLRERRGDTS